MTFRYLDICSGISAPTMAWRDLGWQCAGYSEIEPFPRAFLAERYGAVPVGWEHRHTPGSNVTPLFGDFTQIEAHHVGPIDLLVGGTPCQDFSVAGLRAGLDGDRGNLSLEYLRLADRTRPRWLVWENVPGVLSIDGGRAFGAILGGMGELGYGFAYRIFDAQHAGVPQRRRRVFVVGYLGDWRRAAAVLFERHSLSRNTPPRRETGQGVARTLKACAGRSGTPNGAEEADRLIVSTDAISRCLNAGGMGRQDYETETLITHSLRAEGFDASEDGTGRETPLVPVAIQAGATRENPDSGPDGIGVRADGIAYTLEARAEVQAVAHPIAFSAKDHGADAGDIAPTLRAGGFTGSHANGGVMPAVALYGLELTNQGSGGNVGFHSEAAPFRTLNCAGLPGIARTWAVRRLTPVECERLQGFPDNHTAVAYRGKPAADGPRYKALGNSMAVPDVRWIGERIAMVDALPIAERKAA